MFDFFPYLSFKIVVLVCLIFKFEIQHHVFRFLISEQILPILRLRHPRLRSFSIASRRFESRWVHSVLVCFTLFRSASCRAYLKYVVPLRSFFDVQIWKQCSKMHFGIQLCFQSSIDKLLPSVVFDFQLFNFEIQQFRFSFLDFHFWLSTLRQNIFY